MNSKIKSRKYEKSYAKELLVIAEGDLDAAELLLTNDLLVLLSELTNHTNFPIGSEIGDLTDFATTRRYEDGKVILTTLRIVPGGELQLPSDDVEC